MSETEDQLRAALAGHDGIDEFDRRVLGGLKSVRLDIPLLDRFKLRESGNVIAGYGQRLYAITMSNQTERQMMMEAIWLTRDTQRRILYLKKGLSEKL